MTRVKTLEDAKLLTYGGSYNARKFKAGRCAERVHSQGSWGSTQCSRKSGHGEGGLYCKQHSPEEIAKREAVANAKHKDSMAAFYLKIYAESFKEVLEKIRDGHNDPRTAAKEILDKFEDRTK